ncbi:hypothetical protein DFS34DRAFT_249139 [Phlyctochytrium arcticum]|nr:hypothetical protein DFS34DRAFT_249139 [Phlyctochytrium arcticum]
MHMDSLLCDTRTWTENCSGWCPPPISQIYFAVLIYYQIIRAMDDAGIATSDMVLFLTIFERHFPTSDLWIPGVVHMDTRIHITHPILRNYPGAEDAFCVVSFCNESVRPTLQEELTQFTSPSNEGGIFTCGTIISEAEIFAICGGVMEIQDEDRMDETSSHQYEAVKILPSLSSKNMSTIAPSKALM